MIHVFLMNLWDVGLMLLFFLDIPHNSMVSYTCSLSEKSIYSFHRTIFIHILCNVLSTITVNSLVC
jgi:hypothetical protein